MKLNSKKKRIIAYVLNLIIFIGTLPFRLLRRKKSPNLERPVILVSRPDRIGDVLMSTPIYHSLKDRFPNSKIVLLCFPAVSSLMQSNPFIDEIWPISCPWWQNGGFKSYFTFFKEYIRIFKRIKKENFDIFIELRGDIRHTLLFGWMPNLPMRISNDRSGGSFLLTHCTKLNKELHEIEKNNQLLTYFEPIPKYSKPEIFTVDNIDFLNKYLVSENFVVIFNGGRSPLRQLAENKIASLIVAMNERYNIQCVMVGDQSDAEMAERLRLKVKQESDLINLCGKISLCEVKMLIDKARLFIGSDSSINHIASATNTPSISLFGPMTPSQVQQIGENKLHIYHKYPCSPCLQKKCVITNSFFEAQCMQDITVHEILNLADRLLTGEIFNPKSQPEPANNGESFYPGIKSLTGRVI